MFKKKKKKIHVKGTWPSLSRKCALSPKSSEFLGEQGLQKMAGIVITLSISCGGSNKEML